MTTTERAIKALDRFAAELAAVDHYEFWRAVSLVANLRREDAYWKEAAA
jgi:hypothetical protein